MFINPFPSLSYQFPECLSLFIRGTTKETDLSRQWVVANWRPRIQISWLKLSLSGWGTAARFTPLKHSLRVTSIRGNHTPNINGSMTRRGVTAPSWRNWHPFWHAMGFLTGARGSSFHFSFCFQICRSLLHLVLPRRGDGSTYHECASGDHSIGILLSYTPTS